jgi:glycosyltransferase involved in cell wall biosynthesis
MPVKVSVIVPVWNPGPYIESCVRSILDQSLGPDEVEGILVDDGSTDATPGRLDALAAEHPNLTVIHQENSGWPGKPRNVGMAVAKGEYLYFLDHDDRLGPEALERLYAMARRNDADVVIGKMAGFHRGVPRNLFFANRDKATLDDTPLLDSLTPHKLFRRAFVEEHGLRFPEGRRRLEDLVFVVGAYFAATSISVLSDYVCYYHIRRDDLANAGLRRPDPKGYYGNLREVIGIVEANTEPGPFRDRLLDRFARTELTGRLRDRAFLELPADYREALFAEIVSVAEDHIPPTVDALLAPDHRVQMALLRGRRLDLLIELAEADTTISAQARLTGLRRSRQPAFEVAFQAWLEAGSTRFVAERRGDQWLLPVPPGVAAVVPDEARVLPGVQAPLARLVLRKRDDWAELVAPSTILESHDLDRPSAGGEVGFDVRSKIDPGTVVLGRPLWPGIWDVFARVEAHGYLRDARLGSVRVPDLPATMRPIHRPGRPILRSHVYWTDPGDNLAIKVAEVSRRPWYRRAMTSIRGVVSRPATKP